jgi:hypothetical protein
LQAQFQECRIVQVEAVAPSPCHRLKLQVLVEPAVFGSAEADAPGDAAAGITRQSQLAVPRADFLVAEDYHGQVLNLDKPIEKGTVDQVAHGGKGSGLGATTSTAQSLSPLIQGERWFKSSDHQSVSRK